MTISQPYYIDSFYNRKRVDLIVHIIAILESIKKYFHIRANRFLNKLVTDINRDFVNIDQKIQVFKSHVRQFDAAQAKIQYPYSKQDLERFQKLYFIFEKANFFNNEENKTLSNNILLGFYAIEAKLRFLSFDDSGISETEQELGNIASRISINSLLSHNVHSEI